MEQWPWGRELVLWGSLALNAVLSVLLFFKSAINEIVREWWIGRRRRKEEERNRLHELRRHLINYAPYHLTLMLGWIWSKNIRTDLELQQTLKSVEDTGRTLGNARDFIAANEPRFPPEIQEGLKELQAVSEINDVLLDPSRILPRNKQVIEVCERVVARIDAILKRDLKR